MKSSLPPYQIKIDPLSGAKSIVFYPYADKRVPTLAEIMKIAIVEFSDMKDIDDILINAACLVGIEVSLRQPEKAKIG